MLSNRPYFLAVRDGSKLDEHDPADWSEGDEVAEGEYWDPPCRVCKKVDNESNVLCDICNGAYHLGCLATLKGPPLPRTPEDDEWFCRACVKRGIPESIVDRVGRGSFAHYLVKWIGRSTHEVSWENADALDTPWCRKLITAYMVSEKARGRQGMSLLPPSHPLVDRLQRAKVMPTDASGAGGTVRASGGGAKGSLLAPAPAELARMLDQVATLCQGCGAVEGGRHALGLLARETGELLQLHAHCAALEQCDEDTRAGAKASVSAATDALRGSHEVLEKALRPTIAAAKAQAIQAQARAQAQLDAQRLATHKGTSYQGFLLYLREERPRIRAALPEAGSRAVEKAAATEWKDLEPTRKRQCISRAGANISSSEGVASPSGAADGGDNGADGSTLADISNGRTPLASGACGGGGGGGGGDGGGATRADDELARMLEQVATLCQGCALAEGGRHALGLLSRAANELLALHAHCAALELCDEDTRAGAKACVSTATDALRSSREALETALGPAMEAAKAQAIQAQARAQAQLDAQRLATHKGTSYQGFLLYLREERPRIRAALPEVSSREIEKAAATEWKDLEPTRKRQCISRAAEVIGSNKAAREKAANADDDDDEGAMDSPVSKAVGSSKAASSKAVDRGGGGGGDEKEKGRHRCGGGGGGGRRQPCDVCGTNDKRDFVECCECDARTHLMCFWPPWEAVSKGDKWRCSRCACTPPPPLHELAPAPGEAIEVEVGHLSEPPLEAWKPATVVRLKPGSGGSRFTAKVDLSGGGGKGGGGGGGGGGEDDDDVVEECAVSEHAREWRRPQATAERIDAEREARGAAAAANAALVAQLEGDLAADARPTPSELLPLVEELYRDGMVDAGWSKWPSWRGHSWPPRAHQSASEGLGLPTALGRRGPASLIPPRGRGLPARGRPS